MLESYSLHQTATNNFLSRQREPERFRVVGVKDEEQRGEAIAQQHGRILPVPLRLAHGDSRFGDVQLASGIGQDNQVVVRRVFLEFHFVIFSQLFLPHLLGALHVRELIEESRGLIGGARKQIVQLLRFWQRRRCVGETKRGHKHRWKNTGGGPASPWPGNLCLGFHSPFLFESKR